MKEWRGVVVVEVGGVGEVGRMEVGSSGEEWHWRCGED